MSEIRGTFSGCTRRDLLIGSACLVGAGLAASAPRWENTPIPAEGIEGLIPERLGDWLSIGKGGVVTADESPLARKTYDAVLTRVYRASAMPLIMLLIAYGGNQIGDMQLHRPESCYPAAGFTLHDPISFQLDLPGAPPISARLIGAISPHRTEQILYWTRIGHEFPASQVEQHLAVLRENLRGRMPDGILVRISTLDSGLEAALPVLRGFITALLAASSPTARSLMVGSASARPEI